MFGLPIKPQQKKMRNVFYTHLSEHHTNATRTFIASSKQMLHQLDERRWQVDSHVTVFCVFTSKETSDFLIVHRRISCEQQFCRWIIAIVTQMLFEDSIRNLDYVHTICVAHIASFVWSLHLCVYVYFLSFSASKAELKLVSLKKRLQTLNCMKNAMIISTK